MIVTKSSFNHYKIHTEIFIDASPEQVWSVLTDVKNIKNWSKTIIICEGNIKDKSKIIVQIKPFPFINFTKKYNHKIFVKEGESFGWNDTHILGAHDNHQFILQIRENGRTYFVHSDELIGGMTWLIGRLTMKFLQNLYTRFNKELKLETEKRFLNHQV